MNKYILSKTTEIKGKASVSYLEDFIESRSFKSTINVTVLNRDHAKRFDGMKAANAARKKAGRGWKVEKVDY
jgi:hypothetical protein